MIKKLKSLFSFRKYADLLLYDTMYPNPITGFRVAEFSAYLQHYPNSMIFVNPLDYPAFNQGRNDWENDVKSLPMPIQRKVNFIRNLRRTKPKLFYCVFLNNIYPNIDWIDKNNIPFIFTLYPGGGFNISDETALNKLKRVCGSKNLIGIIVTQQFTKDFLVKNNYCTADKIHFIFGGIIPQKSIESRRDIFFNKNKNKLSICFCAAKYSEKGLDKGFDIFLDVCHYLSGKYDFIDFHVVGGFAKDDLSNDDLKSKVIFHGYKPYEELQHFFLSQDIILSPNRPFTLSDGAFDGFPLGTVVEAALNGVYPIITDELKQNNVFFEDEVLICKPDAADFVRKIESIIGEDFEKLTRKTIHKFREIYSHENQLEARIKILDSFLDKKVI